MPHPTSPRRIDAYRYSWEAWLEGDAQIVGLLDHNGDEHRPMMVAESHRDADILVTVLRALEVKTPDGLPFDPPPPSHA
jgi:hypothetical protein